MIEIIRNILDCIEKKKFQDEIFKNDLYETNKKFNDLKNEMIIRKI